MNIQIKSFINLLFFTFTKEELCYNIQNLTFSKVISSSCPKKCYYYGNHINSHVICALNNITYQNECEMNKNSCMNNQLIRKKNDGHCDPCQNHKCNAFEICILDDKNRAICKCENKCNNFKLNAICGSDNKTHRNLCDMHLNACLIRRKIKFVKNGYCNTDICKCNIYGSYSLICKQGTNQCLCKKAIEGPKCDRCRDSFWGFKKIMNGFNGCEPCNCNKVGAVRQDCNQSTGKCSCKSGFFGNKCILSKNY